MGTEAKTQRGQVSRRRILDVTIQLLCERGYSGTSVNAVCDQVGIAKTALYWHFGSKSGLLEAVIADVTESWIHEIQNSVEGVGTPMERFNRLFDGMRDIVENRSHLFRIILVPILESGTVDPKIREAVLRLTDAAVEAIADGFCETLGVDLPDADLLGHTVVGLTWAALRRKLMDPEGVDLDRLFLDMKRTTNLLVADRMKRHQKAQKKKGAS